MNGIEIKEIQSGTLSGVRAGTGRIRVATVHDIEQLKGFVKESDKPPRPIGSGTNLIGCDHDSDCVCVKFPPCTPSPKNIVLNGDMVIASASFNLSAFIKEIANMGLGGLSSLVGIPGTIGGALAGNAGANGHCIFDFAQMVCYLDPDSGLEMVWRREQGGWKYRKSPIHGIITAAVFQMESCNPATEKELIRAELSRRGQFMPPFPTLGSTFKNPPGGSAGKLLEQAGCKELSCGAFAVYEKHANWIVNRSRGVAPAADYLRLVNMMKQRVHDKFGIELEEEIRQIGEDR